ncbi:MAG: polyisoprenoid-binding protein [Chitinophagaceae bacterium]|nr:MAG: polyisoprenoid-binding protein [Chitinophagaceae bacterium]
MKKLLFLATTIVSLSAFTIFADTWTNDPAHSQLAFTVTHLGVSDVSGTFNDFKVTVNSSKPDFSDATFELNAKVASINTRIDQRDGHLKSPDFFDAEKFPELTFKSTGLKAAGKDQYKLTGDLTLHGVTKPVTLDLLYRGTIENPMSKKPTAGFQLTGTIKRTDFGIGAKFPSAMVSDEVKIKADGEFGKQ